MATRIYDGRGRWAELQMSVYDDSTCRLGADITADLIDYIKYDDEYEAYKVCSVIDTISWVNDWDHEDESNCVYYDFDNVIAWDIATYKTKVEKLDDVYTGCAITADGAEAYHTYHYYNDDFVDCYRKTLQMGALQTFIERCENGGYVVTEHCLRPVLMDGKMMRVIKTFDLDEWSDLPENMEVH